MTTGSERMLTAVRWGLVPSWAKDARIGSRLINARVETAAEKPSLPVRLGATTGAAARRRHYEWYLPVADGPLTATGKPAKQPYFIHRRDGAPLAMAGLYEIWRDRTVEDPDAEGAWLWTTTVLTTTATDDMGRIHDRMPIDVAWAQWAAWLDPGFSGDPHTLLDPAATAAALVAYPVSTDVNNVRATELTCWIPCRPAAASEPGIGRTGPIRGRGSEYPQAASTLGSAGVAGLRW